MSFSDQLKLLMRKNNMKSVDLARLTGLSEAAISDYINGKKEPRGKQSINIAKALNVSLDVLWETGFDEKTLDHTTKKSDEYLQFLNESDTSFAFLIKQSIHTFNCLDPKSQKSVDSFISNLIINIASPFIRESAPVSSAEQNSYWSDLALADKKYWENHNIAAANGNVDEKEFLDISELRKAIDNDED